MAENLRRVVLQLQDVFNTLEEVRLPVLAAIQGGCIGAVDMASACDMRYCTQMPISPSKETQLGMTADLGTLQTPAPHYFSGHGEGAGLHRSQRRCTRSAAHWSGESRVFDTQEAMLDGVMQIASQIAAQSPLGRRRLQRNAELQSGSQWAESLRYMATWQSGMFRPQDMMKCFAAKAQKAAPTFDPLLPVKPLFGE